MNKTRNFPQQEGHPASKKPVPIISKDFLLEDPANLTSEKEAV